MKKWVVVLALLAGMMVSAVPADARVDVPREGSSQRMSRRGAAGHIAVRAGRKHFPANAEVSLSRTRANDKARRIADGLKNRRGHHNGRGKCDPAVLAMYDISIRAEGRKWQPDAGDPVRVTVELDEPVAANSSTLGVAHLADDGTVEELDSSKYGFTYNAAKTAVTAFWFSASGFSVYAIVDGADHTTDSSPARRLYDFFSLDFDTTSPTYNQYVPRYFTTMEGNKTYRQIVKDGQYLERPEALPSPMGRTFVGWHLYDPAKASTAGYDAEGYSLEKFDFDSPVVFDEGETGEHEYILRATFAHEGYLIFHEQPTAGVWPITAVRRSVMTEEIVGNVTNMVTTMDISDLKVTYDDTQDENSTHENATPRMIFRGWSEKEVMPGASKDIYGDNIVILPGTYTIRRSGSAEAAPTHLFPVFVNINWLTYHAAETGEGATYIPPKFYYADEGTNRFPVPSRKGYTFNGWWTGTNTGVRVSNNDGTLKTDANLSGWDGYISGGKLMLNANATLYGRWTPAPTKYTVVIWQQKATDAANLPDGEKTYDFYESYTNTATSATSVSVPNTYKNYSFTNFHYGRCDGDQIIDGNGTTVFNVYYDRNVHTLEFFTSKPTYSYVCTYEYTTKPYTRSTSKVSNNSTITTLNNNQRQTANGYAVSKNSNNYYIKVSDSWYQINSNGSDMYDRATSISVDDSAKTYTGSEVFSGTFARGNAVTTTSYINTLNSNTRDLGEYSVSYYTTTSWGSTTTYYCVKDTDGTWYQISSNGSDVFNYATAVSITKTSSIDPVYSFTGLAGCVVSGIFPIEGYVGKTWVGDTFYTERLASFELLPDTDITFTPGTAQNKHGVLYYYVEVGSEDEMGADGDTKNNKYYKLYKTIEHDYNYLTETEDFHELGGYTKSSSDVSWSGGKSSSLTDNSVHKFYYDRNDQKIEFKDSFDQTVLKEINVKYSDDISDQAPADPTSTRPGYTFTGWYVDVACSTRVYFDADEFAAATSVTNKMLYTTMPAHNLQFFAGWETEWYLIQIDPNGGALAEGQSLWFWEAYDGDPIEEYSTATRSFEENVNGTWFYAKQDRANYGYTDEWVAGEAKERSAYYTTDQSDPAIKDINKRYIPVVNAFRYAGWYEVMPDGSEELYAFGEPVKRNTKLKLHWKHLGTYRLLYDPGVGEMVERDENEDTFKLLDSGVYADSSEILVTRTAAPPEGYSFAGWRIRYGDGTVYHPGQSFVFNSAYAVTVPGEDGRPVKELILDAVFSAVRTVSLTTDANGGMLDPAVATDVVLAYQNAPSLITNLTDTTRTVSGMRNNAYGYLSDGNGYSCTVKDIEGNDVELEFMGWNTRADGAGTHFDPGQYIGLDIADNDGANVLYAEWAVPVYFDKNNGDVEWDHAKWQAKWGDKFVFDSERDEYRQTTTLNGYATFPGLMHDSSTANKMFAFWSEERYKDQDQLTPFDFENTPITRPTTLYAIWQDFIEVPFHPVDASGETPVVREDWYKVVNGVTNTMIRIGNETDISFDADPVDYVTASGYLYSHACLADRMEHISEKGMISRLFYDATTRAVCVEYLDGTTGPIPSDKELYIIYFTGDRQVDIGYLVMGSDGTFTKQTPVAGAPTTRTVSTEPYNMTADVSAPKTYVTGHDHYAFAIGETNATSASQMRIITAAKDENGDRPQLQLRNTWNGFEYSLDGGNAWSHYGYGAQLYVLYFDSTPTIVNLTERTIGTEDDMTNKFEYVVIVSNVTASISVTKTRRITGGTQRNSANNSYPYGPYIRPSNGYKYYFSSDWTQWAVSDETEEPLNYELVSCQTNLLSDGGIESVTLFNKSSTPTTGDVSQEWTYANSRYTITETQITTVTTNMQFVVITQRPVGGFATANDGSANGTYVYTQTAAATNATYGVTYTNTRESLPVELHVAFAQNGGIEHVDNNWRTETEADYTITVPLSQDGTFVDALEKTNVLLRAAAPGRRLMGVYYGRAVSVESEGGNRVALEGPVTSVGFVKKPDADYYRLCLNGDAALELGDYSIYYVYGEIPTVRYMKEGANGALTELATLTYVGNPVRMNGYDVTQGEALDVPMDGTALTVVAGPGNGFRVPLSLDGVAEASLNYFALSAGPANMTATNAMDVVTWDTSLQLKVDGGLLKWSVDGAAWHDFSGTAATVYAIYKEKGYDMTVNITSLASDADKASDPITVTICSSNLIVGTDYTVSGYVPDGIPVFTVKATSCPDGGMLTFTVLSGTTLAVESLQNNDLPYTLRTFLSEDYLLTNILINGTAPLSQMHVDNGTVTYMDMDKTIDFTTIKHYDVTFRDEGGTILKAAESYWYGTKAEDIVRPDAPVKTMDATCLYRFDNWLPQMGAVMSNTVYTAGYRAIPIPNAVQRVADTNITVGLPDEATLLSALARAGIDLLAEDYSEAAATDRLNSRDPNGLRRWENLVTGTATNQLLLSTAVDATATNLTFRLSEDPDLPEDLGYIVLHELRKHTASGWSRICEITDAAVPTFPLDSDDVTGYYRIITLIIPKTQLSITNEIPTTNVVGVLRIASTAQHTMAAVPFNELPRDPSEDEPIKVEDYVGNGFVKDGDIIRLREDDTFKVWTMESGRFEPFVAVKANGTSVEVAGAAECPLVPGRAVWVTRTDHSKPFTIVGQFTGKPVTNEVAGATTDMSGKTVVGCTMIANPSLSAIKINDIAWGSNPADGDEIEIPSTTGGASKRLFWYPKSGLWGTTSMRWNGRRYVQALVSDYEVPAGMGFWYYRASGSGFFVTVKPAEELD